MERELEHARRARSSEGPTEDERSREVPAERRAADEEPAARRGDSRAEPARADGGETDLAVPEDDGAEKAGLEPAPGEDAETSDQGHRGRGSARELAAAPEAAGQRARSPITPTLAAAGPALGPMAWVPASAVLVPEVAADPLAAVVDSLPQAASVPEPAEDGLEPASAAADDALGEPAAGEELPASRAPSERAPADAGGSTAGERALEAPPARPAPAGAHRSWGPETARPETPAEGRLDGAERALRLEQAGEIFKQVRMHIAAGSATLHLEPAWLGRVSIRIAVRGGGKAKAELRTEGVEALAALERHLPELRAALTARGLEGAELELGLGIEAGAGEARPPFSGTALAVPASLAGSGASALGAGALALSDGLDTYA